MGGERRGFHDHFSPTAASGFPGGVLVLRLRHALAALAVVADYGSTGTVATVPGAGSLATRAPEPTSRESADK